MPILLITLSYLSGSVPYGWIIVRVLTGKDLRKLGSGATGGTNVAREAGLTAGVVAGTLDVLKAYFPTHHAVKKYPDNHLLHLLVAAAAMLGHCWSIFLGFRGGKAVSTAAGGLFALAARERRLWDVFKLAMGVFFGAIIGSDGKISLGSLSGSAAGAFYALELTRQRKVSVWYGLGLAIAAAYIWMMHRANFGRLLRGEEPDTGREVLEKFISLLTRMFGRGQR